MSASALPATLVDASAALQARTLSPVELTEALLAHVERLNPHLAAFVTVTAERALADARAAEAALRRGDAPSPLTGVPIGLKDIYDTAGIRTTSHSHLHLDRVPETDATTVATLRAAGTVLLGKLATHEFAVAGPSHDLPFPVARNPWDTERFTGGSSTGSGAALAAGLVYGATGSDTAGSIRTPAHFCGISGIKPTYGLLSRKGIMPLSFSLDHPGPMARTIEDCALLLQAMAGHDPGDPASVAVALPDYRAAIGGGIAGVRVGVPRHVYNGDDHASPGMKSSMDDALQVLTDLGAEVDEATISPLADHHACCMTILLAEALAVHGSDLRAHPEKYGAICHDRFLLAALLDAEDYVQATRLRTKLMAETKALWRRFDALVLPSGWGPAPKLDAMSKWSIFERPMLTAPFNVTGEPVACVPCGMENGLPLGMQVVAAPFAETTALRVAHAYQMATDWHRRRPPVSRADR